MVMGNNTLYFIKVSQKMPSEGNDLKPGYFGTQYLLLNQKGLFSNFAEYKPFRKFIFVPL